MCVCVYIYIYITGHTQRAAGFPEREKVARSTAYSSVGNNNKWFQLKAEQGVTLIVLVNPPLICPEDVVAGSSKMAWCVHDIKNHHFDN